MFLRHENIYTLDEIRLYTDGEIKLLLEDTMGDTHELAKEELEALESLEELDALMLSEKVTEKERQEHKQEEIIPEIIQESIQETPKEELSIKDEILQ